MGCALQAVPLWYNRRMSPEAEASGAMEYPDASADLMLSIARERLERQLSFLDALDNKLATLFAAGSGLLGILAAILALRPSEAEPGGWVALAVAGTAFAVIAYHGISQLGPRPFDTGVDIDILWRDHFQQDERLLAWETAVSYLSCYDQNMPKYSAKLAALRWALKALIIETGALLAGLSFVAARA